MNSVPDTGLTCVADQPTNYVPEHSAMRTKLTRATRIRKSGELQVCDIHRGATDVLNVSFVFNSCGLIRFKDGNILDTEPSTGEGKLHIDDVRGLNGSYQCRAINEFGAEYSDVALLTVLGEWVTSISYTGRQQLDESHGVLRQTREIGGYCVAGVKHWVCQLKGC